MSDDNEKKIWNPIHPDFVAKLLPEYVAHHNATTLYSPSVDQIPWHPSFRSTPAVPGTSEPLTVGKVEDFSLSKCNMRVFTPDGSAPTQGWPVFLFFHGGGWCLGRIDTESAFATNMCNRAKCVVASVNYRLGPEDPYPAAVEDAEEALAWIWHNGKAKLGVDLSRFAVGGSSSGGNLAAILTHKAAQSSPPIPLVFQLLVVPVTDNTASTTGVPHASWLENANTPALTPAKMMWFRQNYSPDEADWVKWDNSPIFAPDEWFKACPRAWICVAQRDILRDEGIAYGEKLRRAGVDVEIKVYQGAPHPIMAQDGEVLQVGKDLVSDAAAALGKAFGTI